MARPRIDTRPRQDLPKGRPPVSVPCPYCGAPAPRFDTSEWLYRRDYGPVYACIPCGAAVGVHRGGSPWEGHPLGAPATWDDRQKRRQAHAAFDAMWRAAPPGVRNARRTCYQNLARALGIPVSECHFGMMTGALLDRALALVQTEAGRAAPAQEVP